MQNIVGNILGKKRHESEEHEHHEREESKKYSESFLYDRMHNPRTAPPIKRIVARCKKSV